MNIRKFFLITMIPLLFITRYANAEPFLSIVYHDVVPKLESDIFGVDTYNFIEQMEYLKNNNYHPVTMDQIIDAKNKIKTLPEKAILITVDDGLLSFYENIFPVLKIYKFPAVLSIVSAWVENGYHEELNNKKKPVKVKSMNWEQLREINDSGLVEIASHSNNLHRGILYNPQGNKAAAGSNFIYDPKNNKYESEKEFRNRIRRDLAKSVNLMKKNFGKAPRIMVWPYGEFNTLGMDEARKLGMPYNFSVNDGYSETSNLSIVNRGIIMENPGISEFDETIKLAFVPQDPIRAMQVDLDLIYDPDPKQQEINLGNLLDRILKIGANTVYLQAFSDIDGDGNASELYFPNSILPMKADLFNRAAHQIRTRTLVENVYAWIPVLSFQLPDINKRKKLSVKIDSKGSSDGYQRLSPFSKEALKNITTIYQDLALHANIDGILFQDDAYLTDFEDFHSEAVAAYEKKFQKPLVLSEIKSDDESMKKWTEFKTDALIKFTHSLEYAAKKYRPNIKTARNIYAEPLVKPDSEEWYAQNFKKFLKHYDYTVVMAYPFMEKADTPLKWLKKLTNIVNSFKNGKTKTVFKLQTYDWNTNKWISPLELKNEVYELITTGAKHIAYYPDNYYEEKPDTKTIKRLISLNSSPFTHPFFQR